MRHTKGRKDHYAVTLLWMGKIGSRQIDTSIDMTTNPAANSSSPTLLSPQPRNYKKEPLIRAAISIKPSSVHRYGVFADELILPGEVIEECPVIIFGGGVTEFKNLIFRWKDKEDGENDERRQRILALGCGSVYNHSDQANVAYYFDYENELLRFEAIKVIHSGDELFVNYTKEWFESRNAEQQYFSSPPLSATAAAAGMAAGVAASALDDVSRENCCNGGKANKRRLMRVIIIVGFFIAAYFTIPTAAKLHAQIAPVATSALHKQN